LKKKDNLIVSDNADFIHSSTLNVLFDMSDSASFTMKSVWNDKHAEPNATTPKDLTRVTGELAKWGDNNLRPQEIKKLIASSFVLKSGFKKRYNQTYSNGILTKIWK
jgi:DNA replication protein DnaD